MSNTPKYYEGTNGMKSINVVEEFQPENYNLGTVLTYIMRAGKKVYVDNCPRKSMIEDLQKIIEHCKFEIERQEEIIKNEI